MPIFPSSLHTKFSTSDLVGQFILCQSDKLVPDGWSRSKLGSWILGNHKRLPVVRFGDEAIGLHGWLLGYAVDPIFREFVFGVDSPPKIPTLIGFDDLESWLGRITGSYVAIVFSSSASRVYLDPSGGLSAVWNQETCICASSLMLVPYNKGTEDDAELINAVGVPESNRFFAFGLTPRHNISRLLPNHYLDLDTWRVTRHWPNSPMARTNPSQVVQDLSQILTGTISAVCKWGEPYMPITAGRDSRMLLACAKGFLDRIQFYTQKLPDSTAKTDIRVAKKMMKKYGLRYKVFSFSESSPADKEEWLYRAGCSAGEIRSLIRANTTKPSDDRLKFSLSGHAGEVGRSFYWEADDTKKPSLTAEDIVARLSLPPCQKIIESADKWLSELPLTAPFDVLDFLYIEQRLGCWAGVLVNADGLGQLPPFSNRAIFALVLGLPHDYRMNQNLATDLILATWPDLLTISPFNPNTPNTRDYLRSRLAKLPFVWRLSRWI